MRKTYEVIRRVTYDERYIVSAPTKEDAEMLEDASFVGQDEVTSEIISVEETNE